MSFFDGYTTHAAETLDRAVSILLISGATVDIAATCSQVAANAKEGASLPLLVLGQELMSLVHRAQSVRDFVNIINTHPGYADALAGLFAHDSHVEAFKILGIAFDNSGDYGCCFDALSSARFSRRNAEIVARLFGIECL